MSENNFLPEVIIYTDGSCLGNPGKGGCAAILMAGNQRKEISESNKYTTNNRMELSAVILGLTALKKRAKVNLFTDSKYIVNAINQKWLEKWQKNNWYRGKNKKKKVLNSDLWIEIIELLKEHDTKFLWIQGHSDNIENEKCDLLAKAAAEGIAIGK